MPTVNLGSAVVTLSANIDRFTGELREAKSELELFAEGVNGVSSALTGMGLAAAGAGVLIFKALEPVAVQGAQFEKSMSAVTAVIGDLTSNAEVFTSEITKLDGELATTSARFENLEGVVRDLGRETIFTADQVAEAAEKLGLAGLNSEQVAGALKATTSLAAAGALEVSEAAIVVASSLRAFGLQIIELNGIVDTFATVQANANVTVEQLAQAFKFASPAAGTFGQNINDVAVILGLLGDVGIRASIAGTGVARAFSKLAAIGPKQQKILDKYRITVQEIDPALNSIVDILEVFRRSQITAGDAVAFFGERAGRTIQALVNVSEQKFDQLQEAVNNRFGEGLRQTEIRLDNVAGAFTKLVAAVNELNISIFDTIREALKDFLDILRDVVSAISDFVKQNPALIGALTSIAAFSSILLVSLGALTAAFALFLGLTTTGLLAVAAFGKAVDSLRVKVAALTLEMARAAAAGKLIEADAFRRQAQDVRALITLVRGSVSEATAAVRQLISANVIGGLSTFGNAVKNSVIVPLNLATQAVISFTKALSITNLLNLLSGSLGRLSGAAGTTTGVFSRLAGLLPTLLGGIKALLSVLKITLGGAIIAALVLIVAKFAEWLTLIFEFTETGKALKDILTIPFRVIGKGFEFITKAFSKLNDVLEKQLGINKLREKQNKVLEEQTKRELAQIEEVNDRFTNLVTKMERRAALQANGTELTKKEVKELKELSEELERTGVSAEELRDSLIAQREVLETRLDEGGLTEEGNRRLQLEIESINAAIQAQEATIRQLRTNAANLGGELIDTADKAQILFDELQRIDDVRLAGQKAQEVIADLASSIEKINEEFRERAATDFQNDLAELDTIVEKLAEDAGLAADEIDKLTFDNADQVIRQLREATSETFEDARDNVRLDATTRLDELTKEVEKTNDEINDLMGDIAVMRVDPALESSQFRIAEIRKQLDELFTNPFSGARLSELVGEDAEKAEELNKELRELITLQTNIRTAEKQLTDLLTNEKELQEDIQEIKAKGEKEVADLREDEIKKQKQIADIITQSLDFQRQRIEQQRREQFEFIDQQAVRQARLAGDNVEAVRLENKLRLQEAEKTINELFSLEERLTNKEKQEVIQRRDFALKTAKELLDERLELEERRQDSRRRKFLRDLQKDTFKRSKEFVKAAELEIQVRKEQFQEELKELNLRGQDRLRAERLLQDEINSIRQKAAEQEAKEREKALGAQDKAKTVEELAAENVAKQVKSVRQLINLYLALARIRALQENRLLKLNEKSAQAQTKVINLSKLAGLNPDDAVLQNRLRRAVAEARTLEQITRSFSTLNKFGQQQETNELFPNLQKVLEGPGNVPEQFDRVANAAETMKNMTVSAIQSMTDALTGLRDKALQLPNALGGALNIPAAVGVGLPVALPSAAGVSAEGVSAESGAPLASININATNLDIEELERQLVGTLAGMGFEVESV